jgi:hypothetical protein
VTTTPDETPAAEGGRTEHDAAAQQRTAPDGDAGRTADDRELASSSSPAVRAAARQEGVLADIARWGGGMSLALLRYVTHRVPLYRRNRRPGCGTEFPDLDRDLPGDAESIQRASAGVGPLYHRRYEIAFVDADLDCAELIERLRCDPNAATPNEISRFERVGARDGDLLEVGDEMVVRLPGPWNGPVRVVEADDDHFSLVTLRGHMEAGQITFSASENERGWTVFAIESWARCGDELFDLLYHRLSIARELQLHMWAHFCERVVQLAGGIAMTNVELHTCTDE